MRKVDADRGAVPWYNVVFLLSDADCGDWELLTFAMKLVNNTLQEIIDRDTFCAQVDCLNKLGMDKLLLAYAAQQDLDVGLSQQFTMYQTRLRRRNVYESQVGEETEEAGETSGGGNQFVEAWTANALSDTLESFLSVSNSFRDRSGSSSESRKASVDGQSSSVDERTPSPAPVAPVPPTKVRTSVHFSEDCVTKSSSLSTSSSSTSSSSDGDSSSSGSESDNSSDESEKEPPLVTISSVVSSCASGLLRGKSSKNLWPPASPELSPMSETPELDVPASRSPEVGVPASRSPEVDVPAARWTPGKTGVPSKTTRSARLRWPREKAA